jgi:hypothetical protein
MVRMMAIRHSMEEIAEDYLAFALITLAYIFTFWSAGFPSVLIF